ncbi:MAG TPA: SDR family oxidoreductase [Bacteroidales bacterium]|jgi:short-subunit dehydrogenase|nr:SDR family oxidoreductase [Bacteroidales bacterium]|tara:strand:+ start:150 stop:944 length:795 start_codon:yes stop_codon:yes gene_type:complete
MTFNDKTVWIIGASSGIGKALSITMAKLQANVVLSSRNVEELEKVKNRCVHYTENCFLIPLDLEKNNDYSSNVKEVIQRYGSIDYLILNGGISQRSFAFETPLKIDRRIMEINYFGNIAITKAVLPYMMEQKSGHIVVVSSVVGKFGFPLRSTYSASKHALHGYYETLRAEQASNRIKVTIVIPGRVKTNISYNAILKDGSRHNQLDDGQAQGISAESCSKQIIKAIKKNKKEVFIGGKEIYLVWVRKFLPVLFYSFVNKIQPK